MKPHSHSAVSRLRNRLVSGALVVSTTTAFGLVLGMTTPALAQNETGQTEPRPNPSEFSDAQMEAVRKEITKMMKIFEFHGYFRAGQGGNSEGGQQNAFQAPGAYAKYRLGNEAEMYGEFGLQTNWVNPEKDDAWFTSFFMWHVVGNRDGDGDNVTSHAIRQAYVEAGHIIPSQPGMSFWAGQRYYRRKDIHINDFFYQNTSGYGAGFQDMDVGAGKLHVAYLGGATDSTSSTIGRLIKHSVDIRLSNIQIGVGELELWVMPSIQAKPNDSPGAESKFGVVTGIFFTIPKLIGGFNEIAAEFGYGSDANMSSGYSNDAKKGWLLRILDRAVFQPNPELGVMFTAIFQLDNRNGDACPGAETGSCSKGDMWVSTGVRPVFSFSKYTGIAVEGGVDITKSEATGSKTKFLGKVTVAPLIRAGSTFWARPEIRAFVTAAFWNKDAKGEIGGPAYADKTFGLTFGVQAESWF